VESLFIFNQARRFELQSASAPKLPFLGGTTRTALGNLVIFALKTNPVGAFLWGLNVQQPASLSSRREQHH